MDADAAAGLDALCSDRTLADHAYRRGAPGHSKAGNVQSQFASFVWFGFGFGFVNRFPSLLSMVNTHTHTHTPGW